MMFRRVYTASGAGSLCADSERRSGEPGSKGRQRGLATALGTSCPAPLAFSMRMPERQSPSAVKSRAGVSARVGCAGGYFYVHAG